MRNKSEIWEIMEQFNLNNPNPKCELNYKNAYTLLVAVLLSAQSTDKSVNKVTDKLFEIADTPEKMLDLGENNLISYIRTIGLFNNKAKNIINLSQMLIEEFDSKVPDNLEDLQKLAGIGRKTANVILNVWYKKATLAVDTHVTRVAHRLEFTKSKTPLGIESDLTKILPEKYIMNANHWLVLFGRYICKAQKPDCHNCFIEKYCHSKDKTI